MYTTKTVDSQTTSPWIPLDDNQAAFNVSVAVAVTGTLTYTVQFTLDNIQDPSITPVAFDMADLTGKTTDASTSLRSSVKAVRLNVTSYTSGTATIGVRQGTSWNGADSDTSSGSITLFQSGIPFWLPPGDGGSNGLTFTGTRGVFTLSAAAPLQYAVAFTRNCYCYLPAGSGGLVTGGWYWCQMSDDTNGEIFQETYSGTGQPKFISTPTAQPDLTAGRITQTLSQVTAITGVVPGGSLGPNGILRACVAARLSNSATGKGTKLKFGSDIFAYLYATTSSNVGDFESFLQNQGTPYKHTAVSRGIGRAHVTATTMSSLDSTDTIQDTNVDVPWNLVLYLGATADSAVAILRKLSVEYGA